MQHCSEFRSAANADPLYQHSHPTVHTLRGTFIIQVTRVGRILHLLSIWLRLVSSCSVSYGPVNVTNISLTGVWMAFCTRTGGLQKWVAAYPSHLKRQGNIFTKCVLWTRIQLITEIREVIPINLVNEEVTGVTCLLFCENLTLFTFKTGGLYFAIKSRAWIVRTTKGSIYIKKKAAYPRSKQQLASVRKRDPAFYSEYSWLSELLVGVDVDNVKQSFTKTLSTEFLLNSYVAEPHLLGNIVNAIARTTLCCHCVRCMRVMNWTWIGEWR